jgi:hypothetical protein
MERLTLIIAVPMGYAFASIASESAGPFDVLFCCWPP